MILQPFITTLSYHLPSFPGKSRIFRPLFRLFAAKSGYEVQRAGARFSIGGGDLIDWYIASQEYESPRLTKFLVRLIGTEDLLFWDVGANVGGVLLPVLSACKNLRSFAFEPSPEVCGRLMRNLQLNPDLSSRCEVLPFAMSSSEGMVKFFPSTEKNNSGAGGLIDRSTSGGMALGMYSVTGDKISREKGMPDVIKLDVEGFEEDILRGLGCVLDADVVILFEHCIYRLKERNRPLDEVINYLKERDFEIYDMSGDRLIEISQDNDFVALKGPKSLSRFQRSLVSQ